ncbi:hypothetical protein [Thermus amyloliquefaciens]|uniref:hypothetical protein n=1 Tax=Thermus amyloliquefaciens TaxID=1449080 RepID=UPI000A5B2A4D|nr:hypothetical protein [Thermus amyloliquefaciens]
MEQEGWVEELERALQGILGASSRDSGRQNPMADYLVRRLRARLPSHLWAHLRREVPVRGLAREKSWDVGLVYPEGPQLPPKPRLLLSLKSILRNPGGSWPNRLDDLVGEVSSVQMLFPEVVVGYVVVLDYGAPTKKRGGDRYPEGEELASVYDRFKEGLKALSRRQPPLWAQGLVEGHWVIEVDSRRTPLLRDPLGTVQRGEAFLDALIEALRKREPLLFLGRGQ